MLICPANGHAIDPEHVDGPNCVEHGVPLFYACPDCDAPWPTVAKHNYMGDPDSGANFCANCAAPAPWLSRAQLVEWVRNKVRAAAGRELSKAKALELDGVLRRIGLMQPDDTKAVEAWKLVRDTVPKVWKATKPVRDVLIGEAVKKMLGG